MLGLASPVAVMYIYDLMNNCISHDAKELEKLPDSMQKEKIIAHLEAVKNGTRDLRF